MSDYTIMMEDYAYDLASEDLDELTREECINKLIEIANSFRTFGQGMTFFIISKGYSGDVESISSKVRFIENKFKEAGITCPRDINKWFTEGKPIDPLTTGYKICFAFGLKIDEVNDFFRRICWSRGIDCHRKEEAIYYYCLKNGYTYQFATELLDKISVNDSKEKEEVYTSVIVNEIDKIDNHEDFIKYIESTFSDKTDNNKRASEIFCQLWNRIKGSDGLVNREIDLYYKDDFVDSKCLKKKKIKADTDLLSCILGIAEIEENRSIKKYLRDNPVLRKEVEKSFPDRQTPSSIIRGEQVKNETMRKYLILVSFYSFWVNKLLVEPGYETRGDDFDRCLANINSYLIDSGYPQLYYGNPYDWIFLYSMLTEKPLDTFRSYMSVLVEINDK